jgi:predicted TPR repeat methyltransferase
MLTERAVHTSGDLIADRRYGYGQALLAEGDFAAAVDLFEQTMELVPSWPPGWFALGDAQDQAGDRNGAILSFTKALALSLDDVLGAGLRLARLDANSSPATMTQDYVAALFDQYADRFDDHLVTALDYRGPAIIKTALEGVCRLQQRALRFSSVMDLGCGTGLMARAMAGCSDHTDGIDLSPAMVSMAVKSGFYRAAWVGDAVESMTQHNCQYTLILAADILVYIGDLEPLLTKCATTLEPEGLLAFTVQAHNGEGFRLGADLRFHHSEEYLRASALRAGLRILHLEPCVTRQDAGKPVPGFVVVMAKAENIHGG